MITPLTEPLRVEQKVLVYGGDQEHTTSFGYEWTSFPRVQTDSSLGVNLSLSRLELNLGFPARFLKGMAVLELGSGAGRFTEHFATYAKAVVTVDLSDSIYHNAALGTKNVVALKCDLMKVPELSAPIDLVFCRGVIQHTVSPAATIRRIFDYVRPGGLVIFDVYKKHAWDGRSFKYFWRPFFKQRVPLIQFGAYLQKNGEWLYRTHHRVFRFLDAVRPVRWLVERTPLYLGRDWDSDFPNLTHAARVEMFKADLIDALYAEYDQPMTPEEVLAVTSSFGQVPYSYDLGRNHFRYVKNESMAPLKARFTKNGALPV
jgi:2-polyprenyl-3-methyl-5-hydroxy-6-metoxy-1,4-benzoquinol methylase